MDVQFTRPYLVRGDRKQSSQPGNAADKDDRITNLLAYDTCRITIGGACKKQSSFSELRIVPDARSTSIDRGRELSLSNNSKALRPPSALGVEIRTVELVFSLLWEVRSGHRF